MNWRVRSHQSKKKWVTVNDRMQKGYRYELSSPAGRNFDPEFEPEPTPVEMLALGVFCGKYMTDTRKEFPKSWFESAKLAEMAATAHSTILASMPAVRCWIWRTKRLASPRRSARLVSMVLSILYGPPNAGGRQWQIKRWKAFRRHIYQIELNCEPGDPFCRPGKDKLCLHWAYDSRKI